MPCLPPVRQRHHHLPGGSRCLRASTPTPNLYAYQARAGTSCPGAVLVHKKESDLKLTYKQGRAEGYTLYTLYQVRCRAGSVDAPRGTFGDVHLSTDQARAEQCCSRRTYSLHRGPSSVQAHQPDKFPDHPSYGIVRKPMLACRPKAADPTDRGHCLGAYGDTPMLQPSCCGIRCRDPDAISPTTDRKIVNRGPIWAAAHHRVQCVAVGANLHRHTHTAQACAPLH